MPGMSRVYYSNSGSEANEKGFKIVRQIAHKKYGGKKHKILYRDRDYHGTTITALSASGQEGAKWYGPFTPGFVAVPHCCNTARNGARLRTMACVLPMKLKK
ncbi:MAG: aminotransferase class III-fold pyridoxal phosphate-dependent enzyme [Thiolinea sp.]